MNKELAKQYFYLWLPQTLPPENMRAGNVQLIYMLTLSIKKNELGSSLKENPFRENPYELRFKKLHQHQPSVGAGGRRPHWTPSVGCNSEEQHSLSGAWFWRTALIPSRTQHIYSQARARP